VPAGDKEGNLGLSQAIFRKSLRLHLPELQPLIQETMEETVKNQLRSDKIDADGKTFHSPFIS